MSLSLCSPCSVFISFWTKSFFRDSNCDFGGGERGGCFIYCRTSKVVSVVGQTYWGSPLSLRVAVVSGFVVYPSSTIKGIGFLRIISMINVDGGAGGNSTRTGTIHWIRVFFFVAHLFAGIPNVVDPGLEMMSRGAGDQSGATFFLIGTAVAFGPGGVLC